MSHIPSSAMPHAKVHDDDDTASTADKAAAASSDAPAQHDAPAHEPKAASATPGGGGTATSDFPIVAIAIGGLVAVGAIAAAVLPLLRDYGDETAGKPKKKKKSKKGRADA